MASETSNGANLAQTAQGFPSAVVQSPGAIQYGQQLGISNCAPQQVPQKGALEKIVNAQARVLGAVQIMVGLIHIGFGAVSLCLLPSGYVTLSAMGGNPFWGGICFIASGSLCVAAEKRRNHNLVKCSLGMNITSAIMALVGILLYISELAINRMVFEYDRPYETSWVRCVGIGLSSVLFLFYLLEFCITVSFAHFGCQATCCADDQAIQIINGLIHIGFGGVSVCLFNTFYYISVVVLSGYPFWGGILFIASGSLTVAAGKSFKHSLAQCSARVNIASAVVAFIGMFLLSVQLFLNRHSYAPDYFEFQPDFINAVGTGLTILYLLFSISEFCITVWIARLGCRSSANRTVSIEMTDSDFKQLSLNRLRK